MTAAKAARPSRAPTKLSLLPSTRRTRHGRTGRESFASDSRIHPRRPVGIGPCPPGIVRVNRKALPNIALPPRAGSRHFATRFGAPMTCVGAMPAVVHVVLAALLATSIADLCAKLADAFREFRSARHLVRGKRADVRARPVQFDAARKRLHVVFLQARTRTVLARGDTLLTSLDTMLVFFVRHFRFSVSWVSGRISGLELHRRRNKARTVHGVIERPYPSSFLTRPFSRNLNLWQKNPGDFIVLGVVTS